MGYYNPLLSYGEERILRDAKEAGVNGFIVVDLPPEEAVRFRNFCTKGGSACSPISLMALANACDSQSFLHTTYCTSNI